MTVSDSKYRAIYKEKILAGKNLGKMDFSFSMNSLNFETFWCRCAFDCIDTWNKRLQVHSFGELHLGIEGKCEFEVCGERYTVKKGSMLFIPAKTEHKVIDASEDFFKFVWGVRVTSDDNQYSEFLEQFFEKLCKVKVMNTTGQIDSIMDNILDNAHDRAFEYHNVIKSQMYNLFISIMRLYCTDIRSKNDEKADESKNHGNIKNIVRYIGDNLSKGISSSDIARQFHLSERQLNRILRKTNNTTISELKASVQLESVKHYLASTDLSLKEIAVRIGFCDEYAMSKMFKRLEGTSPGKYRTALKE